MRLLRILVLIAFAAGGVWGAFRLLDNVIHRSLGGADLSVGLENLLLLIPVGIVGGLVGVVVGGLVVPGSK